MVESGKKGKKTGEGFYKWEKGKPQRDDEAHKGHDLEQLAADLVQPYLDECMACLRDDVVESEDLLDAGMIFGTGFAPFRGGPVHYVRNSDATASADDSLLDAARKQSGGAAESGDKRSSRKKRREDKPEQDQRERARSAKTEDEKTEGERTGSGKTGGESGPGGTQTSEDRKSEARGKSAGKTGTKKAGKKKTATGSSRKKKGSGSKTAKKTAAPAPGAAGKSPDRPEGENSDKD
jgi:hypothetical protein